MTSFLNYTMPFNITGFPEAMDYTNGVMQTAVGSQFYGPLVLLLAFLGFYAVSSNFSSERSLSFSMFMTALIAFLLVSAQILDPIYIVWVVILLAGCVFFWGDRQ